MRKRNLFNVAILLAITLFMLQACGGAEAPESDDTDAVENDVPVSETPENDVSTDGTPDVGEAQPGEEAPELIAADLQYETSDGFRIVGTYLEPPDGTEIEGAVLLVPMLGHDRTTYWDFQDSLALAGFSSLSIDMRGHGDSTMGRTVDYTTFSEEEWMAAANDIRGGLDELRRRADSPEINLAVIGASIGANLSVIAVAYEINDEADDIACMVLLSPGEDYHGVRPITRADDLGQLPVLIVSAQEDNGSFPGSQSLSEEIAEAEMIAIEGSSHGTDIFETHGELEQDLIGWLKAQM